MIHLFCWHCLVGCVWYAVAKLHQRMWCVDVKLIVEWQCIAQISLQCSFTDFGEMSQYSAEYYTNLFCMLSFFTKHSTIGFVSNHQCFYPRQRLQCYTERARVDAVDNTWLVADTSSFF